MNVGCLKENAGFRKKKKKIRCSGEHQLPVERSLFIITQQLQPSFSFPVKHSVIHITSSNVITALRKVCSHVIFKEVKGAVNSSRGGELLVKMAHGHGLLLD